MVVVVVVVVVVVSALVESEERAGGISCMSSHWLIGTEDLNWSSGR